MNWNTKAKTRVSRGKSKDSVENMQRLAAWNKAPNLTSRKRSADHLIDYQPVRSVSAVPYASKNDQEFGISGDLLMLKDIQAHIRSMCSPQKILPISLNNKKRFGRPPSATIMSSTAVDPLTLMQLTPEKGNTAIHFQERFEGKLNHPENSVGPGEKISSVDAFPSRLIFFNNGSLCHELTGLPMKSTSRINEKPIDSQRIDTVCRTTRQMINSPRNVDCKANGRSEELAVNEGCITQIQVSKNYVPCQPRKDCKESTIRRLNTALLSYSNDNNSNEQKFDTLKIVGSIEAENDLESTTDTLFHQGLTNDNWWSRFLELIDSTVLVKNPDIILSLSEYINLPDVSNESFPKTVLLATYRTLNQLSSGNDGNSKVLSADETTALCDAIRLLELVDKQFSTRSTSGDAISTTMHNSIHYSCQPSTSNSYAQNYVEPDSSGRVDFVKSTRGSKWNLFDGAIQLENPSYQSRVHFRNFNDSLTNDGGSYKCFNAVPATMPTGLQTSAQVMQKSDAYLKETCVASDDISGILRGPPDITDNSRDSDDDYLEADLFL